MIISIIILSLGYYGTCIVNNWIVFIGSSVSLHNLLNVSYIFIDTWHRYIYIVVIILV